MIITTRGEELRFRRLRDAVGGYDEMERLLRERRMLGPGAVLIREADGRLAYISAVTAARRKTPSAMAVN